MPSPGKGGEKSTLPLPASEGQARLGFSSILGMASASGNNTTPSHSTGEGETLPSTAQASPTLQESFTSRSTGLVGCGSEPLHHSNSSESSSGPLVYHGPKVEVEVRGLDPRLARRKILEGPKDVVDSEKKVVTPTGPAALSGTSGSQQRADQPQPTGVERQYKESPSRQNYRERSPIRSNVREQGRFCSPRPPTPSPRRPDCYRPSPRGDPHNKGETPRGWSNKDDHWRPGREHGGRSGREPRPPTKSLSGDPSREDRISRGTARGRSLSPPGFLFTEPLSHQGPSTGESDPMKASGSGSRNKNSSQSHAHRDSKGGMVTSGAQGGGTGYQSRVKDLIYGDRTSTSASKATSRGCIGGYSGDGKNVDKPHAVPGTGSGPTAATFRANPSPLRAVASPGETLLQPAKATLSSLKTHLSPRANIKPTSIAPEGMGDHTTFITKTSVNPPPGATALSGTLLDPTAQRSTMPSKAAFPSSAQEIPKPPPLSNILPGFGERLTDREIAKKLLGVSGDEFDAEMARRTADFDANIARRKALGHPIHGAQVPHSGGQILAGDNSETGESSRGQKNIQIDTPGRHSTPPSKGMTLVGSSEAMPADTKRLTPHTYEPKADMKGKGKEKAEISNSDNDFSEANLWPGADNLDETGPFNPFSPKWRPGSAGFVDGAPEYHIPKGFFGSSPEPSVQGSPRPFNSSQRAREPQYVDRATSPDPTMYCTACGPPIVVSLEGCQPALYNVHLKDTDDMAHLLFTNIPRNYYLLHVLTFSPYKSRLIHSDQMITLRNFTKIIRLGFGIHTHISQVTVYLYGRDNDGFPLDWKPINISNAEDWDGCMKVGREWGCQISVVVEFVDPDAGPAAGVAVAGNPTGEGNQAESRK